MQVRAAGDPCGLVAHLTHFYSILKLPLVLLAKFSSFLARFTYKIAGRRIFILRVRNNGVWCSIYHAACDDLDMRWNICGTGWCVTCARRAGDVLKAWLHEHELGDSIYDSQSIADVWESQGDLKSAAGVA